MSRVFADKIATLPETVRLASMHDIGFLSEALERSAPHPIAAVGSGGSVVAAEFLSSCRSWLRHGPTSVCTPMTFALDPVLPHWGVWLFSASADNPDIRAAFRAASIEHKDRIDLVTNRRDGAVAADAVASLLPRLHVLPVAEAKDGFLATHSLISVITSLLLASDQCAGEYAESRVERVVALAHRSLQRDIRALVHDQLAGMRDTARDTLIILHDPALTAAAVMIETSCWETGLCSVQRTDFRNFAHGRHVWLTHKPERTFVLALTQDRSQGFWASLESDLPSNVARAGFDFGPTGRASLYDAVLRSFSIVEGIGLHKDIDPGKPGVGDFGRRLFDRESLLDAITSENIAIRRKRRAEVGVDRHRQELIPWPAKHYEFVRRLGTARIGAVVLDYDGTVVSTDKRLDPPSDAILVELERIISNGLTIALATGRGGSVGEMLRSKLPADTWRRIPVGYYNGAHIVGLDVDLEANAPEADAAISDVFARIIAIPNLFKNGWRPKPSPFQVTIQTDQLTFPNEGARKLRELVSAKPGVRIFRSGHSLDICPTWGGKRRVLEHVAGRLTEMTSILSVGDSGDRQGNDFELLDGRLGLSVDKVCDREDSCWNLLPPAVSGPDGLLRILRALCALGDGTAHLDVARILET